MGTKIKSYAISCSSDVQMDARSLYVWGELGAAHCLPESAKEARRRVLECRKKMKCAECDAEIHVVEIERSRATKLQIYQNKQ